MHKHTEIGDPAGLIGRIELFSGLDAAGISDVSANVKWREYAPGSEVFSFREKSDEVYLVGSGRVRVTAFSSSGREIAYEDLGAGHVFGELAAIDGMPRTAGVIALEKSVIGAMSARAFRELTSRYPSIASAALSRLARMVRALADRVYRDGALDVRDRVRLEVLRMARQHAAGRDEAVVPDFPTHAEIASRIDTHREAVSRELSALARMGVIRQRGRILTVTGIGRLSAMLPEDL